jgi:hypothetical protein
MALVTAWVVAGGLLVARRVFFDASRGGWECRTRHPKRRFTLKTGTAFESSRVGFDRWLPAIWLVANYPRAGHRAQDRSDLQERVVHAAEDSARHELRLTTGHGPSKICRIFCDCLLKIRGGPPSDRHDPRAHPPRTGPIKFRFPIAPARKSFLRNGFACSEKLHLTPGGGARG